MAITYYMLQINPVLFFILITGTGALCSIVLTFIFRKFNRLKILRSHNEVTGFFFIAIAGFYGLLLSFVVLVVWDQLNETRGNVSKEGSSALGLYRDIKFYPDTLESKQIMKVYLDFVYNVIDEEFPNMENMKLSRRTPESFDFVFYKMQHMNPKTPFQVQLVSGMYAHLIDLGTYRGLRMSSMETEISPPIWLPMILGGFVTIICSIFLDIENKRLHLFLNSLLGIFIGLYFFIIILLDHPFSGSMAIQPKSYLEIFTLEQWDSEGIQADELKLE